MACIFVLLAAVFVPSVSLAGRAGQAQAVFIAVDSRQWAQAKREAKSQPLLKHYVEWMALQDDEQDASFAMISHFIDKHPKWPAQKKLQLRAERALFQERNSDAASWLKSNPPVSGYGKLALARLGGSDADALIKEAWRDGDFESEDAGNIAQEFGDKLTEADHRARIERLLRDEKATIAERMLPRVDQKYQALYRARIALIREDGNAERLLAAVPSSLAGDDGLMADRILWRDRKGKVSGAIELLKEMDNKSKDAERVWPVRAYHVREFIEVGNYNGALALLSNYGEKLEGPKLADALWLMGWLQLEFLKNPKEAYKAFFQMHKAVNTPVSKSRAGYWAARAAEDNGNPDIAKGWYGEAAKYPTTFYGQLAFAEINPGKPLALPDHTPEPHTVDYYRNHPVVRLIKTFYEEGQEYRAVPFIKHLADEMDSPLHAVAMAEAMVDRGMEHAGVIAAKQALRENIVVLKQGWPVVKIGEQSNLEAALPLAIARQESEFNAEAESPAGARGLMQLMPSTARKVAKQQSMAFNKEKLFNPSYNATLGSIYLEELVDKFDGSYILAIAGYNAGPSRSVQWSSRFGTPGRSLKQSVRFVEMIPFYETRNYVQRVLENTQVYRAILNPQAPLGIARDLMR